MSTLTGVERALERFGQRMLGRIRDKEPVELVEALRRECDEHIVVCSESRIVVPNAYDVELAEFAHEELERNGDDRIDQILTDTLARHGERKGYEWAGPLAVHVTKSCHVPNGRYRVASRVMHNVRADAFPRSAPA
ncbi:MULTISPECIES: FhaA domain-containing protein [unclassified Streptomyces]|uniref:FhaA domain-containing protein n=1 Tax=unclassified Streptomyces TaxID=2593676 RepID=UPI00365AED39